MNPAYVRRGTVGTVVGAAWIAGLFVAEPLVGGFGPVPIAEGIITRSPGWLSTTAISLLGFYAKPALLGSMLIGIVGTTALVAVIWPQHSERATPVAIIVGVGATAALFFAVGVGLSLEFFAGLVVAVVPPYLVARALPDVSSPTNRRRFLRRVGTVAAVGTLSFAGLRLFFDRSAGQQESSRVEEPLDRSLSPPSGDPAFDFDGMPTAVIPPEEHYVVDISIKNPEIDPETWTFDIDGAVKRPYSLTYDELLDHEASVEQTMTMICISNQVGGDLIGTAHWTGVQLSDLVEAAEQTEEAVNVVTHAADGYSEAIPIGLVEREDILIAYGMGDRTLGSEHGFPVRLLIPGRYGMKMTKWITRIEVADEEHEAYWEARGWDEEATVNIMSYVRGAERDGGRIVVGGVAFAGLETGVEEIAAVEVSVDGGETWNEAELESQLDAHAWRRWRYVFEAPDQMEFEVVARAITHDGTVQTSEETSPRPSGATGWHRMTVQV